MRPHHAVRAPALRPTSPQVCGGNVRARSLQPLERVLRKYPRLPDDVQEELLQRAQAGDIEARNRVVLHNIKLVHWLALKFTRYGFDIEELVNEGTIGAIKAIENYVPAKGTFKSYMGLWVNGVLIEFARVRGRTIRIQTLSLSAAKKVRSAKEAIWERTGRDATNVELAAETQLSMDEVREGILVLQLDYVSLESPLFKFGERDTQLHEILADDISMRPDHSLDALEEFRELRTRLLAFAGSVRSHPWISERNKHIFIERYGLDNGFVQRTFDEISAQWNVSRERIRQVVLLVWYQLDKLNNPMTKERFLLDLERIPYLEDLTHQKFSL